MKLFWTFLCFIFVTPLFSAPCGLKGSIDERINECAKTKDNFVLVTSTEEGREVYKDTKSGLIWSSRINYEMNHFGSQKICPNELPEAKILSEVKWRLPTLREFEQSAIHGMKTALPNMNHWFWTSTPQKVKKVSRRRRNRMAPAGVFMWDGVGQISETGSLKDAGSVRCVGQN